MTLIHTPYGDMRLGAFSEPLLWHFGTEIPGLVIDGRRLTLNARHDLHRLLGLEVWDYAYREYPSGSASGRAKGKVEDADVLQLVSDLIHEAAAEVSRRLRPRFETVTEIVIDHLSGDRQAPMVARMLREEFDGRHDEQTIEVSARSVLVTGRGADERRILHALRDACVPASVHSRTAQRVITDKLPDTLTIQAAAPAAVSAAVSGA